MTVVTVTASAVLLDQLADALGRYPDFRLARVAFNRLEVEGDGMAYPLLHARVDGKVRDLTAGDASVVVEIA